MNYQGKRIVVTGGAGFIGSELVRQLIGQGARVTVVDDLTNGKSDNLKGLPTDQLRLVVADICQISRFKSALKGCHRVFHLACLGVRHSIHTPLENHRVNAEGTLKLLLASRALGAKRFICVSSSEVYGTAIKVPMVETHPTFPLTVYGSSKLAGECYARAFYRTYGYPTLVIRPFNTYGPRCHHEGDSGEVIPKFMLRCMAGKPMVIFGDGSQLRDFTFVRDTARGILLLGNCEDAIGQTVNLGQGKETSVLTLAQKISYILDRPGSAITYRNPRPGDVLRLHADTTLAKKLIKFKPQVSLEQGLMLLRDWYLESGKTPQQFLKQEQEINWKA